MPNNAPDVIFLIGAGFSKPAGVPLMAEFVTQFIERVRAKGDDYKNYLTSIIRMMAATDGCNESTYMPDLEVLMDILQRLGRN